MSERELLGRIKSLIKARAYRVRIHAVRHMVEEGFRETDMKRLLGKAKSLKIIQTNRAA